MDRKIIQIGEKTYKLLIDNFESDIDIDSLLKIDYSNLVGEIITFPVIVNRFGQLLADAESQVAEVKLSLEIFEAKTKESLRIQLSEANGGKAPTVEMLNNSIMGVKAFQVLKKKYIEVQKTRDYMNSIFWSAKDKSAKLDKLSLSVQPGDIPDSVIEGKINNVLIKRTKKLID